MRDRPELKKLLETVDKMSGARFLEAPLLADYKALIVRAFELGYQAAAHDASMVYDEGYARSHKDK